MEQSSSRRTSTTWKLHIWGSSRFLSVHFCRGRTMEMVYWVVNNETQSLMKTHEPKIQALLESDEEVLGYFASRYKVPGTGKQRCHLYCFTSKNVIIFIDRWLWCAITKSEDPEIVEYRDIKISTRRIFLIQKRPCIIASLPNGERLKSGLTRKQYGQVRTLLVEKRVT